MKDIADASPFHLYNNNVLRIPNADPITCKAYAGGSAESEISCDSDKNGPKDYSFLFEHCDIDCHNHLQCVQEGNSGWGYEDGCLVYGGYPTQQLNIVAIAST